jgi:hypothetical protein
MATQVFPLVIAIAQRLSSEKFLSSSCLWPEALIKSAAESSGEGVGAALGEEGAESVTATATLSGFS